MGNTSDRLTVAFAPDVIAAIVSPIRKMLRYREDNKYAANSISGIN